MECVGGTVLSRLFRDSFFEEMTFEQGLEQGKEPCRDMGIEPSRQREHQAPSLLVWSSNSGKSLGGQ